MFSRRVVDQIQIESTRGFTYSIELLVKAHRRDGVSARFPRSGSSAHAVPAVSVCSIGCPITLFGIFMPLVLLGCDADLGLFPGKLLDSAGAMILAIVWCIRSSRSTFAVLLDTRVFGFNRYAPD